VKSLLPALLLMLMLMLPAPAGARRAEPPPPEPPPMDTQSVSCGRVNRGGLAYPAALAPQGEGYIISEPWRSRGLRFGTEELVGLIRRAAAAVNRAHPGALLGVGDLSKERGGSAPNHRSHQAGRDVDLLYYAVDEAGKPMAPGDCMPAYAPDAMARLCYYPTEKMQVPPRRFDVKRNWALIKAMLTDEHARVRVVFMSLGVRRWLLDHAAKLGEPRALIRRAEKTLMRPPRGRAHTDHMHVRIRCSRDDRWRGRCRDDPDRRGRFFGRLRCPRRGNDPCRETFRPPVGLSTQGRKVTRVRAERVKVQGRRVWLSRPCRAKESDDACRARGTTRAARAAGKRTLQAEVAAAPGGVGALLQVDGARVEQTAPTMEALAEQLRALKASGKQVTLVRAEQLTDPARRTVTVYSKRWRWRTVPAHALVELSLGAEAAAARGALARTVKHLQEVAERWDRPILELQTLPGQRLQLKLRCPRTTRK